MASLKSSYTKTVLQTRSVDIGKRLEMTPFFQQASCIAIYHALPDEVETEQLLERWYERKKLLLPVVKGDNLQFQQYRGKDYLQQGTFHIWEPSEACPIVNPEEIELVIVPGVAFDRQHNRLGRGKGFYDRLLARIQAFKTGICFDFQLKEQIPAEPFDEKMDWIVTEKEII